MGFLTYSGIIEEDLALEEYEESNNEEGNSGEVSTEREFEEDGEVIIVRTNL
jgi:hypothetical protein